MRKLVALAITLSSFSFLNAADAVVSQRRRVEVDRIVARVNGRNVLASDLKTPRIEKSGNCFTLDEAIDNEILFQRAADKQLLPTGLDVEKYIHAWKEMNNLTSMSDDEFEKRLQEDGLTIKKYKGQLARSLAIKNLRQMEMSQRSVTSNHEIEEYYKKHPTYAKDRYLLQTKIVPPSRKERRVKWIDLDWIEKENLSDKISFVPKMKEGEISRSIKTAQGAQHIKLVKFEPKHLKTLDESWAEIDRAIRQAKMEIFEAEYMVNQRKRAHIRRL